MANRLALLAAVVLGVVAALAVNYHVKSKEEEQASRFALTEIAVARRTLKPGEELTISFGRGGMIQYKRIPQEGIASGMITRDAIRRFNGYVVRERIEVGEPLFRDRLQPPYEQAETQASVVADGMRAVTLSVDLVSGVAGLLRPGDRVDVLGTFRLKDGTNKTVYLLQNARIISLDSRTELSPGQDTRRRKTYRSVTLEVPPYEAVRLVNAQSQGKIRLVLRNRGDVALQPQAIGQGKDKVPVGFDIVTNELPEVAPHTRLQPELD